ncbi:hypothetical protein TVAG_163570 [Trichomonas vaginalis G3]|uniref:WD repeat protein n=1 Tax=Trichomonas vaginalis (strain ATCC PRA-98 / G3) TaxID=412133 RepID=A2DG34_TRIV3|nr:WD repeat protein family [Trichomonas vaginalis G3]EAY20661.1 hypothetical protein TVAG_163570 [Trichomonas vaginalis G3]KAI5487382.1 WD repeat protein family [Trichomonas vaginalis G3]|eukprot:XP_001581647.1 hypothetical protein [Trichomonas vaginalis G3]
MTLLYGPSALSFSPKDKTILIAGVGPAIRVYKEDKIYSEFSIFPETMRIMGIFFHDELIFAYAENILKIFLLQNDYKSIEIKSTLEFIDWIVTAHVENDNKITSVLHHGQIVYSTFEKIENLIRPTLWKIVVSAKIIDAGILVGDSFGTISLYNPKTGKYFEANHDKGSVFDIDYKDGKIITSYEFHSVALWNLKEDSFEFISATSPHPSRVFGAKFVGDIPISLGEDGYMKFHDGSNQSYHLHRTKLITAFAVSPDNEIATAGYDCVVRRFFLPEKSTKNKYNCPEKRDSPVNVIVLANEKFIIANNNGDAILMPENKIIAHSNGAFFVLGQNSNYAAGASRAFDVFIYDTDKDECVTARLPREKAPSTIAVSKNGVFVVLNDMTLVIFNLAGQLLIDCDASDYFKRPPSVSFAANEEKSLVVCAHSTRITVFDFDQEMKSIVKSKKIDTTSGGFSGATFYNGCYYIIGRNDGVITILKRLSDEWEIKSLYQIPGGAKSAVGISTNKEGKVVVGGLSKTGISFYDITAQTEIGSLSFDDKHLRSTFVLTDKSDIFSSSWEAQNVYTSKVSCIGGSMTKPSFHGLRGLFATKSDKLFFTGSCDRDIRVWSIKDDKISLEDDVQSVDSGTHAIVSDGKTVFTGGSQQLLFEWVLDNNKLYQIRSFDLTPLTNGGLCKRRVTTLSISPEFVFVFLSDATLFKLKRTDFELVEKCETPGVAMSSDYSDDLLICCTSKGNLWWNGHSETICKCGIHSVKIIKYFDRIIAVSSCDDGFVRLHEIKGDKLEMIMEIGPNHTGGVKSVDVQSKSDMLQIVSFSYDQRINLYTLNRDLQLIDTKRYDTAVSHGESVLFVEDGFVAYGTGLHYFKL